MEQEHCFKRCRLTVAGAKSTKRGRRGNFPQRPRSNARLEPEMVGLDGLEPTTSVLSGPRSNRLSYRPTPAGATNQVATALHYNSNNSPYQQVSPAGILNRCWGSMPGPDPVNCRGGFITRPGDNGRIIRVTEPSYPTHPCIEPGRVTNLPLPAVGVFRPEHQLVLRIPSSRRGNRTIKPSFRRKPESRGLDSRPVLSRGISWIPAFARTTVAWVATVPWVPQLPGLPG